MTERHVKEAMTHISEDVETLQRDISDLIVQVREKEVVQRYYKHNPYVVIAAAAGVGYVVGGGLFTPFTKRLVRFGMKAMFVPIAATQFKGLGSNDPF